MFLASFQSSELDSQRPAIPKRIVRRHDDMAEDQEEEEEEGRKKMIVERKDGCPAPPVRGTSSSSFAADLSHGLQTSTGVLVQIAQGPPSRDESSARHRR